MTSKMKYALPLAVAAVAGGTPAEAADNTFLKVDGVAGESRDDAHKGEIDVLGWSWNLSQDGTVQTGPGRPQVRDIKIIKFTDSATADPTQLLLKGEQASKAVLTVRSAGEKAVEYFKVTMSPVLVTRIAQGGSGGDDRLTETIALNFNKFCVEYTARDPVSGAPGSPPAPATS